MIRLGQTITTQQPWSACSQVRICKKPRDRSSRSVLCDQSVAGRPGAFRDSFLFCFLDLIFYGFCKLGSERIGESNTVAKSLECVQSPSSIFSKHYFNLKHLLVALNRHLLRCCLCKRSFTRFPPFCPSPPSAASFSSLSRFHFGILPSLIFPF